MNPKVEKILRKAAYEFAIKHEGATEAEALAAADRKIKNVNKAAEAEANQEWVDITTGETHIPKNPY